MTNHADKAARYWLTLRSIAESRYRIAHALDYSDLHDIALKLVTQAEDALKVDGPLDNERFERAPDGNINNCALASDDSEVDCQICNGKCPDRGRFPRKMIADMCLSRWTKWQRMSRADRGTNARAIPCDECKAIANTQCVQENKS